MKYKVAYGIVKGKGVRYRFGDEVEINQKYFPGKENQEFAQKLIENGILKPIDDSKVVQKEVNPKKEEVKKDKANPEFINNTKKDNDGNKTTKVNDSDKKEQDEKKPKSKKE